MPPGVDVGRQLEAVADRRLDDGGGQLPEKPLEVAGLMDVGRLDGGGSGQQGRSFYLAHVPSKGSRLGYSYFPKTTTQGADQVFMPSQR